MESWLNIQQTQARMYNMEYALINLSNNELIERKVFDEIPSDISHKGVRWLPIIVTRPACNIDLQIEEGPTVTITESSVNIDYNVRTLTQQEIRQKLYDQITQELFGKNISVGQCLLLIYNEQRQVQNKSNLSQNDFVNLILDTYYFVPETEENLIQYDKSGNPIQ